MTLGDPCKAQWGFGVTCHLGAWSVFRGIPDVQLQGLFGNTVGNASWVLPESLSKFPTTTNGYSFPPEDPCRSRLGRGFRATVCRWGAQSVFGRMTDIQLRAIFGQKIDDDASLIGEKSKQGTQLVLYKDFFLFTKVVIDGKTKPFRFGLTYYVKDTTGKAICEYVATALKEIDIINKSSNSPWANFGVAGLAAVIGGITVKAMDKVGSIARLIGKKWNGGGSGVNSRRRKRKKKTRGEGGPSILSGVGGFRVLTLEGGCGASLPVVPHGIRLEDNPPAQAFLRTIEERILGGRVGEVLTEERRERQEADEALRERIGLFMDTVRTLSSELSLRRRAQDRLEGMVGQLLEKVCELEESVKQAPDAVMENLEEALEDVLEEAFKRLRPLLLQDLEQKVDHLQGLYLRLLEGQHDINEKTEVHGRQLNEFKREWDDYMKRTRAVEEEFSRRFKEGIDNVNKILDEMKYKRNEASEENIQSAIPTE